MKSIRSGRGLGDAIYLQSVVRYFVERGQPLEVCTDWPDLFRLLGPAVQCSPFRRTDVDIVAHYTARKGIAGTDQFRDCCISAGISADVEFRLEWDAQPCAFRSEGTGPLILLQMYRQPFDRKDGYGIELLPKAERMQDAISAMKGRARIVEVGKGPKRHKFRDVGTDLTNRTSIRQVLDLACFADGFLGYCSFFAPLAEALGKPALFLWSMKGLRSRQEYIRTITPEKILRLPTSFSVRDDCSDSELAGAVDALLEASASR